MAKLTITEALAELKTLVNRIEKKQEFVQSHLGRLSLVRDQFEAEGGAPARVAAERQSIADLSLRLVRIRVAIQQMNQVTTVTILGRSYTIAEWLTWRKEIAPRSTAMLTQIRTALKNIKAEATKHRNQANTTENSEMFDVILHVNESDLAKEIDDLENTLGTLDGQLSLTNATTFVEIAD